MLHAVGFAPPLVLSLIVVDPSTIAESVSDCSPSGMLCVRFITFPDTLLPTVICSVCTRIVALTGISSPSTSAVPFTVTIPSSAS